MMSKALSTASSLTKAYIDAGDIWAESAHVCFKAVLGQLAVNATDRSANVFNIEKTGNNATVAIVTFAALALAWQESLLISFLAKKFWKTNFAET